MYNITFPRWPKKRRARKTPKGIDKKGGEMMATPTIPKLLLALTMILFVFVNVFLFLFRFGKCLSWKRVMPLKIQSIRKENTIVPVIPPEAPIKRVSRKVSLNANTAVGIPASPGLIAQERNTAIIFPHSSPNIFRFYNFSPYARSPASPNPGTIYDCAVNSSSTAPSHNV